MVTFPTATHTLPTAIPSHSVDIVQNQINETTMKTTKIFMMIALALMTTACNKDDFEFEEKSANGEITITATISADNGPATRALSIDGDNIASTWAATDEFAILFNDGTNNVNRTATVSSIGASSVTITFTVPSALADDTPCTIVYPASAANTANTGADVATALATQDGTIGNCPEVRIGTATIDKDNHKLTEVTKLAAQNAIFKFTLGSAIDDTHPLIIKDGSNNTIITVTPTTSLTEAYVAMPAGASTTYKFQANTADNKIAKSGAATIVAGKYYQTNLAASYPKALDNVTADDLGSVITSDGSICLNAAGATAAGKTIVAMIAYVYLGDDSKWHGLAIELNCNKDYTTDLNYDAALAYARKRGDVYGLGTWQLPSNVDWQNMFLGCRVEGDATSALGPNPADDALMGPINGFVEKMTATGSTSWYSGWDGYWSYPSAYAWELRHESDGYYACFYKSDSPGYGGPAVLACLPF